MDDSDSERLRRDTNQRTSEDTGWRDWPRVFRTVSTRTMQEIIRSVEARLGDDEATVTELDHRFEEWASAELKSVAADFCHALILFCKGKQGGRRI